MFSNELTTDDQMNVVDTTAIKMGLPKSVPMQFRDQNMIRKTFKLQKEQRRREKKMGMQEAVEIPSHTLFEWIDRELRKTPTEQIRLVSKNEELNTKLEEYPCSKHFLRLIQKFNLGTHFEYKYRDKKSGDMKWKVKFAVVPSDNGEFIIRAQTIVM